MLNYQSLNLQPHEFLHVRVNRDGEVIFEIIGYLPDWHWYDPTYHIGYVYVAENDIVDITAIYIIDSLRRELDRIKLANFGVALSGAPDKSL